MSFNKKFIQLVEYAEKYKNSWGTELETKYWKNIVRLIAKLSIEYDQEHYIKTITSWISLLEVEYSEYRYRLINN